MKELGLTKGLLDSVSNVMKDSAKSVAEQSKTNAEQLTSKYASKGVARPLSMEEAKAGANETRAAARRVAAAIQTVYDNSIKVDTQEAKQAAAYMEKSYSKVGGVKPITEAKDSSCTDPMNPSTLKSRKAKAQADVADETILDGEQIVEGKPHTVPKTDKEKKLAALAEPKDKITHADVLTGRGVRKEGFAEMDAWLKKRKEEQGTGKFDKKKISTGTVYTKKSEKEQEKMDEASTIKGVPAKNTDVSDKSWLKTAGKKPGPLHNVAKGLKAFVQGKPEPMESVEYDGEQIDERSVADRLAAAKQIYDEKMKSAQSPAERAQAKDDYNHVVSRLKEEVELEEATHVFSGFTSFMKKHASKLRDAGLKVTKVVHDPDSGTTEYHTTGPKAAAHAAGKEYEKADKGQNYGGRISEGTHLNTQFQQSMGHLGGEKKPADQGARDHWKDITTSKDRKFKVNKPGHPLHGQTVSVHGWSKDGKTVRVSGGTAANGLALSPNDLERRKPATNEDVVAESLQDTFGKHKEVDQGARDHWKDITTSKDHSFKVNKPGHPLHGQTVSVHAYSKNGKQVMVKHDGQSHGVAPEDLERRKPTNEAKVDDFRSEVKSKLDKIRASQSTGHKDRMDQLDADRRKREQDEHDFKMKEKEHNLQHGLTHAAQSAKINQAMIDLTKKKFGESVEVDESWGIENSKTDTFKVKGDHEIELHKELYTGGKDSSRVVSSEFKLNKKNPRSGGDWHMKVLHQGTADSARKFFNKLKAQHGVKNESVTLSAEELARIEEIAKQFESKE